MSDKYFVGSDVFSSSNNGKYKPVSRITLKVDDSKVITSGDDTGFELVADCPHATQSIADSLLSALKGIEYQTFSADGVNINPSAEIGDGVTVRGIYSVLSMMRDDGTGYPSVEAPGKAEDEDEYPAGGPMTQEFERQLAATRSLISKTSEEIRLEVSGLDDKYTALSVTLDGVTISDSTGKTLIKGSSIDTSTIKANSITADKLNLTGAISFGDLDAQTQIKITNAYDMAYNNQLPSYIKSTYIDRVSIQSPTIVAGTFIGNEFNVLSESSGGSFNLYGKFGNYSVKALEISYAAGDAPVVYFGGTIARFNFGAVYYDCGIDIGLNDLLFNAGGYITSLREMESRLTALESK